MRHDKNDNGIKISMKRNYIEIIMSASTQPPAGLHEEAFHAQTQKQRYNNSRLYVA